MGIYKGTTSIAGIPTGLVDTVNGKLDLTGGTLTGNLTISQDGLQPKMTFMRSDIDSSSTTAPSSWVGLGSLLMVDQNGKITGYVENAWYTDGTIRNKIGVRRIISSANKTAEISLAVDSSGVESCTASTGVKHDINTWSFPSTGYTDLTLGASGSTYTAPANGWLLLSKNATASGQYYILRNATSTIETTNHTTGGYVTGYVPAKKGDSIYVEYSLGGTTRLFRFIYSVGDNT